jgi:MFS family permease
MVGAAPIGWKALMASASRILLGVCEAGILTVVNTLIADYWQDSGRRNWLMLQGLIGPFFQSVVFIAVAQVAAWRWNGGFLSIWRRCRSSFRCVSPSSNPAGPIRRPWPRPLCCSMRARRRFAGAAAVVGHAVRLCALLRVHREWLAWGGLGVTNPMDVSTYTFIPSLFILVGRSSSASFGWSNAAQIGRFWPFWGWGWRVSASRAMCWRCNCRWPCNRPGRAWPCPR